MPYINFYLENLDRDKNEVHLLYWNRDLKEEDTSALQGITLHEFRRYQEDDVAKFSKVNSFIAFRKFAKLLLKKEPFDFLIVLHSMPGVLLRGILKSHFKNRFIFDYRDSTYEKFRFYKRIIGDVVKASRCTFVSSDGFRKFLPESENAKIFTSHNILLDSLNHREEKTEKGIPSQKIRISFWGFIRHEDINREMIRKIARDDRFELHYYGREQRVALNLKAYAKELNAANVFFHGEYKPEERYEFVRSTDLIHNVYCDANMMLAMGNKYYDGAIFRIPQICMADSFMGKMATEAGIGFMCDPYEDRFTDSVYDYYQGLELSSFYQSCDVALNKVMEEYHAGNQCCRNIFGTAEK